MKRILLASLLAISAATASAATYKIDSFHTNARFMIDHFGTSTNVGGIYGLEGKVNFDAAKRTGSIDVKMPLANLQTGSEYFTNHLKSADLFNVEKFPEMRFQSTQFVFSGNTLKSVKGNLKTQVCGGDFTTTIDRTKWGMDYLVNAGMTKKVQLNIQIEAGKE